MRVLSPEEITRGEYVTLYAHKDRLITRKITRVLGQRLSVWFKSLSEALPGSPENVRSQFFIPPRERKKEEKSERGVLLSSIFCHCSTGFVNNNFIDVTRHIRNTCEDLILAVKNNP